MKKKNNKYVACALLLSSIAYCSCSIAQRKLKDYEVVTQKGILFLSWNNVHYIDSLKDKHSIDALYTPDIFLPVKKIDTGALLAKSFRTDNLETGIQIFFEERNNYTEKAQPYKNDSIGTPCYTEKGFSLLPVTITYKKWKKYSNILVCEAPVVIYLNKRKVSFRYVTPSVELLKIVVLNMPKDSNDK